MTTTQTTGRPALELVKDTLARLSIGRTKLYELIEAGDIEAVHIGRHTRVVVESVDAYVQRLRNQGRARSPAVVDAPESRPVTTALLPPQRG